jgi:hypothetical protein
MAKWYSTQLLDELVKYEQVIKQMGANISIESRYYTHPHPRVGYTERVTDIIVRKDDDEYGFSVHELRTRSYRSCWISINPGISRRKVDEELRKVFKTACRNLICAIVWGIIQKHDFELYRSIFRIAFDDEQLVITFKGGSGELVIPVERLTEQELLLSLAQLVAPC